jgi:hypothetical protein
VREIEHSRADGSAKHKKQLQIPSRMRSRVIGVPLWLIVGVCSVPPIAYSLASAAHVPVELVLPTAVAMEVVFLTQTVQQALHRAENRRHFKFALWELHQEMSQHLETLDRRIALVRRGVKGEPSPDGLRTWASSVDPFPTDAWDRFLTIGGLHRLLDTAPDQVAANLYRYYNGVRTFNNEAALRQRMLHKLFEVTGPATTGIFKTVKSSDRRLESWLVEVPPRLAVLMRDLQLVLRERGRMPAEIVAVEAEKRLATFDPQQTEAYLRWRAKHGDVPALPEKGDGDPWVVEIEP